MDKVVHFEIPADDVKRAQKFYKDTFDWHINEIPDMNYTIVSTVEIDENQMPKERGAINGGLMQRQAPINSPVITINVADIDKAVKDVVRHGGSVVRGKFQVGDIVRVTYEERAWKDETGVARMQRQATAIEFLSPAKPKLRAG